MIVKIFKRKVRKEVGESKMSRFLNGHIATSMPINSTNKRNDTLEFLLAVF
jgi:hypothetical protein